MKFYSKLRDVIYGQLLWTKEVVANKDIGSTILIKVKKLTSTRYKKETRK